MLAAMLVAAAVVLLFHAFSGIDPHATARALLGIGPFAPLILLPFVGGMLFDATGQRLLLRALGREVSLTPMLLIRVASEALHLTAPAGFLVADTVTAKLLHDRFDVPLPSGAVLAVARKWLVMRAHAVYIVLGGLVGAGALEAVSPRSFGGRWLPCAVCAMALIPLGLSAGLGAGFHSGAPVARLQRALQRMPLVRRWKWTSQWSDSARAADDEMTRIDGAKATTWAA